MGAAPCDDLRQTIGTSGLAALRPIDSSAALGIRSEIARIPVSRRSRRCCSTTNRARPCPDTGSDSTDSAATSDRIPPHRRRRSGAPTACAAGHQAVRPRRRLLDPDTAAYAGWVKSAALSRPALSNSSGFGQQLDRLPFGGQQPVPRIGMGSGGRIAPGPSSARRRLGGAALDRTPPDHLARPPPCPSRADRPVPRVARDKPCRGCWRPAAPWTTGGSRRRPVVVLFQQVLIRTVERQPPRDQLRTAASPSATADRTGQPLGSIAT